MSESVDNAHQTSCNIITLFANYVLLNVRVASCRANYPEAANANALYAFSVSIELYTIYGRHSVYTYHRYRYIS